VQVAVIGKQIPHLVKDTTGLGLSNTIILLESLSSNLALLIEHKRLHLLLKFIGGGCHSTHHPVGSGHSKWWYLRDVIPALLVL